MKITDVLRIASDRLTHVDEGSAIGRILLAHVLQKPQSYLFSHSNYTLSKVESATFEQLLSRAANHEPVAYLIGHKEFFGLDFVVTPEVLIPRAETEELVSKAVSFAQGCEIARQQDSNGAGKASSVQFQVTTRPLIVDVGTGSGCVAVSIAKRLPEAQVYAIDISAKALKVARTNARRHAVQNTTFALGCLLEPLQGLIEANSVDIIVANLPYISDSEYESLPLNVRDYEPALALKSGSDPDTLNRQLTEQAKNWLRPGGLLAYETTNGEIVDVRF